MRLRVTTWNVNSVRLRLDHIAQFVADYAPDVLCMQEIKCQTHEFPAEAFAAMGMPHLRVAGQKGWHGVAIASRYPLEDGEALDVCRRGEARCVTARIGGVDLWNFYIPAGGDTPDRAANDKFDHKLDFYERLTRLCAARDPSAPLILTGDLNIAPGENDVWNHKHMLKVVSHTPAELEAMAALKASLGFIDLHREAVPEPAKLFSWWSYRAADFRASNRGLRLDHIWVTPGLAEASKPDGRVEAFVHDAVRAWEKPSDHAPATAVLDLSKIRR